jgi:CDP-diacylglycerol--serine O-phosphatidyltransferase
VPEPTPPQASPVSGEKRLRRPSRRELVFILPNLFTTANLFLGFFSIISAVRGAWTDAALGIVLAALTDGLDGRIARMTNTQSAFGEEYDSMSDLVSFGAAPALLMYQWALAPYGRLGWLVSFLYLACAALRLARFNVLKQSAEKRYFQGCPSPIAACTVAAGVMFYHAMGFTAWKSVYMLIVMFALGTAMVSTIRYRSFKDLKFKSQQSFGVLIVIVSACVLFSTSPERFLFPLFVSYVGFGFLAETSRFLRRHIRWIPGTGRS